MAWSLGTAQSKSEGYASSGTIASFTPTGDRLMYLWIDRLNGTDITSITSGFNGGTDSWTELCDTSAGGKRFWVYALIIDPSPSASTIVVSWSTSTGLEICAIEIDGADITGTAAATKIQDDCGSIYNGSGAPFTNTFSLASFASSTNMTIISGTKATAGEAGYTTAFSGGGFSVYYKASEDTSPSYDSTQEFDTTIGSPMEVKEATGGGGGLSIPVAMRYYRNMRPY